MPGIILSPSGCCCGCAPGSICVTVNLTCGRPKSGVTVSASGPSSASAMTDATGLACLTGLPAGTYTVTASQSGCDTLTWSVTLACGGSGSPVGTLICDKPTLRFVATSCILALPGVQITVNPGGLTCTTGSDGTCLIPVPATGSYTWTAVSPAPRIILSPSSGTVSVSNICSPQQVDIYSYPAPGYICCLPGTPYPCKDTLLVTDDEGVSVPITVSGPECAGTACADVMMDDVATGPGTFCYCNLNGNQASELMPPPRGSALSRLLWSLDLNTSPNHTPTLSQGLAIYPGINFYSLCPTTPNCQLSDTSESWRVADTCASGTNYLRTYDSISYVINSLYPLNITFFFDDYGETLGPQPYPGGAPIGKLYTTTATVHE